jgi:cysteine desulfurase
VAGFGEACRIAAAEMAEEAVRIGALRDRLLRGLQASLPGLRVNGTMRRRLPGNLNITLPHATALAAMQAAPELCVSTGSACSSAEITPSYVLTAMGLSPDAAARSLRLGLGRFTSPADVDFAIRALTTVPELV